MDAKTNYQASAGKRKHLFQGNGFRKQEMMIMLCYNHILKCVQFTGLPVFLI